jgi:riboflavin kinase/FMN adenylyltransferase
MAIYYPGELPQPNLRRPVITIGTFDGVHLGHRLILNEVKRHAAAIGGESMVLTFEPHPRQVLQPEDTVQILTPLPDKLTLITEAGIQHIAVAPFTKEFSRLSAAAYVEDFLVGQFHPAAIVIGYDHHFGHDRGGNISLLNRYSATHHFDVHEIPAHMVRDAAISSSRIRSALQTGDVAGAAQMLGRPYAFRGTVVAGQQLGRTLGYPTANVQLLSGMQLIPAQGVYAVRVSVAGEDYGAMLSIGTRPTVNNDGKISIEAFLFDFSLDIYGQEVVVHFIRRMRDELKFDSLDALKEALRQDEINARKILSGA